MLDLESIVSQFIFQLRSIALGSGLLPGEAIVHLGPDAATSRADTHACLTKCLHAYMGTYDPETAWSVRVFTLR